MFLVRIAFPFLVLLAGLISVPCATTHPQDPTIRKGLELFRKPDRTGRACSSCHSPDGIELAAFGFSAEDIVRRSRQHVTEQEAQALADYLKQLRFVSHIDPTLDPMKDRPLQPAGKLLEGVTPQDRDLRFAEELKERAPKLFGSRVATVEQAHQAFDEILAIDLMKLPIGIAFSRLSEDEFHGREHSTIAQWIPDAPALAQTPQLRAMEETYLAEPSDSNLARLDAYYRDAWDPAMSASQSLFLAKTRSLLKLQHLLRMTGSATPTKTALEPHGAATGEGSAPSNPWWEVGDLSRIYSETSVDNFGLPRDVVTKKRGGPTFSDQLKALRLPWLWLGWMTDPSLQRTSLDKATRQGDYFSQLLLEEGPYVVHTTFMLARKLAEQSTQPSANSKVPKHLVVQFSALTRNDQLRAFEPADPKARHLIGTMIANTFRTFALLLTEEMKETGVTYLRDPLVQQLTAMRDATARYDSASLTQDSLLFGDAIEAVKAAKLFQP